MTALDAPHAGLWLAGNQGMEKQMETIVRNGYLGTTTRIHSFIPS